MTIAGLDLFKLFEGTPPIEVAKPVPGIENLPKMLEDITGEIDSIERIDALVSSLENLYILQIDCKNQFAVKTPNYILRSASRLTSSILKAKHYIPDTGDQDDYFV